MRAMKAPTLVLGLATTTALIALMGCGGSDEAASETSTVTVTETTTTESTTERAAASWAEFGATLDDWNSAHEPDTRYDAGCCFLPSHASGGGRYAATMTNDYRGTPRVDGFEMFFDDPVPLDLARQVVKNEAPPGSRLMFAIKKADCMMIQYRSRTLTRTFGSKSAVMLAALYSSAVSPFNGRTVNDIIFLSVGGRSIGC